MYDAGARDHIHFELVFWPATSTFPLKNIGTYIRTLNSLILSRHQIYMKLFRLIWEDDGSYTRVFIELSSLSIVLSVECGLGRWCRTIFCTKVICCTPSLEFKQYSFAPYIPGQTFSFTHTYLCFLVYVRVNENSDNKDILRVFWNIQPNHAHKMGVSLWMRFLSTRWSKTNVRPGLYMLFHAGSEDSQEPGNKEV